MANLEQVQTLIDQLELLDQVRLLEYLAPRIVNRIQATTSTTEEAWQAFFQIGDAIADLDTPESETLTKAIATMRRSELFNDNEPD